MADHALDIGSFADESIMLARALDALLPPRRVSVAEWAARHRYLANAGGGYVGRWDHGVTPYLVEPMESWTSRRHDTMAIVGPGQSAKTTVAENALLHAVSHHPGNWLWYMQTDQAVQAYVKGRVDPMIADHATMRAERGLRAIDDSLHFKRFRKLTVEFLAANRANLINKSAPIIVADEVDAWPKELGDPVALLNVRRQTFGTASMLAVMSHPDLALDIEPTGWTAGVMAVYAESTQGRWYWPCPHCGGFSSPTPGAARAMEISWDRQASDLDAVAASAHMVCPVCGSIEIFDRHRPDMLRAGRWVHRGQTIAEDGTVSGDVVECHALGYWITGAMSPFVRGGLGGMVRARVKAERDAEVTGADGALREVMPKVWGWPWPRRRVGRQLPVAVAELLARVESYPLRVVPEAARVLVAWVDVQASSFDVMVRAYGPGMESWVVDVYQVFRAGADGDERPVAPATHPEDWDLLSSEVLERTYPVEGRPDIRVGIFRMGVDSGGAPGVTEKAYGWWRRMRALGLRARVLLTKGAARRDAARLKIAQPDRMRTDRRGGARGEIPVGFLGTRILKDELDSQLRRQQPGPGYVHLSEQLLSSTEPHVFFEGLTAEERRPDGTWEKVKARNEPVDQMVGTAGVALSVGIHKVNWDAPPSWAAPWPENAMARRIDAAGGVSSGSRPAVATRARRLAG